jgi:hypothetical protein
VSQKERETGPERSGWMEAELLTEEVVRAAKQFTTVPLSIPIAILLIAIELFLFALSLKPI